MDFEKRSRISSERSEGRRESAPASRASGQDQSESESRRDLEHGSGHDSGDSDSLFERAQTEERAGREDEAAALYRRAVHIDPDHVQARNRLGALLDRSGEHDAALEHFRAALQLEPEDPAVLTNLGSALGAIGRHAEAERVLKQAMALQPDGVETKVKLAHLHLRRGLYGRAEAELRAVCERAPDNAAAQLHHGEVLSQLDRVDEALAALERASRVDPGNPRIFYLMGVLYDKKHLPQEAAVMYRRAWEMTR